MKIGVPYREAFEMSAAMRLAWLVIDGENDGRRWDWKRLEWEEPRR